MEKPLHTYSHLHLLLSFRLLSIEEKDKYHPIFRTTKIFVHPTAGEGIRQGGGNVNLLESSLHMKNLQPPDQHDTKANMRAIIQLFLQIYLY